MTISEYLKNPYGKGSAFSGITKQQEDLDKQYKELEEKIACRLYRYRDFVIYHVVIPSTKKDTVNYDVVVEVETKNLHAGAATLEDLDFKVFSNCPSFIFTYANAFRNNNMMCEWLIQKYNPEVRKKAPVQRNKYGIIGLERSVYLALKYLHSTGKTKCGVYQTTGRKIMGRTEIINAVRTQQQIMDKVREKVPLDKTTKEVGKDASAFASKSISTNVHRSDITKKTKKVLFSKSIKTIKETKKTKSSKTTKKI